MADPVTLTIAVAAIPPIIAAVQSGLQGLLNAMPEILHEAHDASTKRSLTKLNALFLKAQMSQLTEKDFQKAIQYYVKIEAVAVISQNQMMLDYLKEGLTHLKTTLVVKKLLDKNPGTGSLTIEILDSKRPAFDGLKMEGAMIETRETSGISDGGVSWDCSIPLESPSLPATDKKLTKFKAWERPALWGLVAVMPGLLFVPEIRHKCGICN